jgi:hypothetical protein
MLYNIAQFMTSNREKVEAQFKKLGKGIKITKQDV